MQGKVFKAIFNMLQNWGYKKLDEPEDTRIIPRLLPAYSTLSWSWPPPNLEQYPYQPESSKLISLSTTCNIA